MNDRRDATEHTVTASTLGVRSSRLLPVGTALAAVLGATRSDFVIPNASAEVLRKRERENSDETALLLVPPEPRNDGYMFAGHRSHSSHKSHSSHVSGKSHYSGGYVPAPSPTWDPPTPTPAPAPPPPPPKPAVVSFAAFPGGRIFIDGKLQGRDVTGTVILAAGRYNIRVENRFLGDHTVGVDLSDGQTGVVVIKW